MHRSQMLELVWILGLLLWVVLGVVAAFRFDRRTVRLSRELATREAVGTGLFLGSSGTGVLMAGTVVENTLEYWVGHLLLGAVSSLVFSVYFLTVDRRRRALLDATDDSAV